MSLLTIVALIVGVLGPARRRLCADRRLAGARAGVNPRVRNALAGRGRSRSRCGSRCRPPPPRTRTWSRRSRRRASFSNAPPPNIQLTYDEAVEPRFAIISVTNADGHQETTAPVHRSPANPDTLVVPLRPTSARGVVPDLLAGDLGRRPPGRGGVHLRGRTESRAGARSSAIPNISATATTPQLLIARWVMFLAVMAAIGLFVMRLLIARPLVRDVEGASLRRCRSRSRSRRSSG